MKVEKSIDLGSGHKIEIGSSSWDDSKKSIRNRYPTSTGGFSPHSSSELPVEDISIITLEAIKNDLLSKKELKEKITKALIKL